jgi:hypothetical protein
MISGSIRRVMFFFGGLRSVTTALRHISHEIIVVAFCSGVNIEIGEVPKAGFEPARVSLPP